LYPGKAAAVFATMMVIAFGFVGDHHPYRRFGPANHVTMIRAMLVALIASLIGEPEIPRVAATGTAVAVVMTVLDGVDGWLARRSRMTSAFGARFDVETDAVLIMAMSILVWQHGKAGAWVLLGGMMRYAFVMAGSWLPWMARPLRPTRRAKTVSVCHMVGLSVALAPIIPTPLSAMAVASAMVALSWSFAVDVRRLWRME
jgi:phosphatidylglycerophosphate synthase